MVEMQPTGDFKQDVDGLKQDVDGLKQDIAELKIENGKTRASVIRLGDIADTLQEQHNRLLQKYSAAKARIVELEKLDALRVANRKISKKAMLVRERSRSRSRTGPPRWDIAHLPKRGRIVVTKQKRDRVQLSSHPCFNHPNCIIVAGVHELM